MDPLKAGLSREALKGFFTFLLSEKVRHNEDIDMIEDKLERMTDEYQFTDEEVLEMLIESQKYVQF